MKFNKYFISLITATLMSFTLVNQVCADESSEATMTTFSSDISENTIVSESPAITDSVAYNPVVSETPVFEASNVILNGQGEDITSQIGNKLQGNYFTVVITYNQTKNSGVQALFGISNSKIGNQNSYLDVFVRDNGELGMEARDTSSNTNNLVFRPASVWGKYQNKPVSNIVALVADSSTNSYSLYANGTKLVEKKSRSLSYS